MIKQTEVKNNHFLIEGDCIEELINYCLNRVRNISKSYYKKELRKDLESKGFSWIDYHGGIKNFYDIKLINNETKTN